MKPVHIIQYWHKNTPDYIQTLIDSVIEHNPECSHRLFDDIAAGDYIRNSFGERYFTLYDNCTLPAMRSDIFRYCYLFEHGGIYVDADFRCNRSLKPLIQGDHAGCLYHRNGGICNGLIYVREPNDALMKCVLDYAVENIEKRESNSVWAVTGPNIFRQIKAHQQHAQQLDRFNVIDDEIFYEYFSMVPGLPYKKTSAHWSVARKLGLDIYRNL